MPQVKTPALYEQARRQSRLLSTHVGVSSVVSGVYEQRRDVRARHGSPLCLAGFGHHGSNEPPRYRAITTLRSEPSRAPSWPQIPANLSGENIPNPGRILGCAIFLATPVIRFSGPDSGRVLLTATPKSLVIAALHDSHRVGLGQASSAGSQMHGLGRKPRVF